MVKESDQIGPAAGSPARSKPLMVAAVGLLAIFTVADFAAPSTMLAILYAVPLVLMAQAGYANQLRRITAALVIVIYAVYFGKWFMYSASNGSSLFDYRFVNRSLVVLMICLLQVLLKMRASATVRM